MITQVALNRDPVTEERIRFQELKAVTWMEFRHFDLAKKHSAIHPEDLMSLFAQTHLPDCHLSGFDAGVREISGVVPEKCPARPEKKEADDA